MKRTYFGKYKDFQCIADKCPDTCCSGWAVEIDDESLDRYEALGIDGVDYQEGCFLIKENNDCYYLNEKKLCDLYLAHGEGVFCRTCDMYPRHIEEFPGVREYSLSLSCPEAARQFLTLDDTVVEIVTADDCDEDNEEYEDFNYELYDNLAHMRSICLKTLKSDTPLFDKLGKILGMARKIQDEIDLQETVDFNENGKGQELHLDNDLVKMLFDIFMGLEPLNDAFRKDIILYKKKLSEINDFETEYNDFVKKHPEVEENLKRIAIYFIYTYLCGAVYDDYVYGMAAVAVFSTCMIAAIWVLSGYENAISALYKYSRELEHSTDNMIKLEQLLDVTEFVI